MEQNTQRHVPFFRLLIPFVLGIISVLYLYKPLNGNIVMALFLLLFAVNLFVLLIPQKWHYRLISGLLIFSFLYISGILLTTSCFDKSKISLSQDVKALVRLIESPEERNRSQRAIAIVETVIENEAWVKVNEKVILYFSVTDTASKSLRYGSRIAIQARFNIPSGQENPYQFSYSEYLARKNIYRVAFVNHEKWIEIEPQNGGITGLAFSLRERLLKTFRDVGIEGQNLAVLTALTSGYKSLLDDEIKRVYSASGAMHILAVSGLHVGILFLIVSASLFFFDRIKHGKKIKAIVLIGFLWFFAIFTGLSASVMRASLMFSLVILGIALNRKTNIYNTLSASAFILLAFNPMLITEIGFQLSYLAVISIVFFYPYIYKLLYIKNKWLDKVWVLIAVSTAAQIGTFIPGLYYFNQFPSYFLLTNLFAIPLATAVLYLAVTLLVISPLPFISTIVGWTLDKTLWLLNNLVKSTESLPFSTINGITLSVVQTLVLSLSLILLIIYLEKRKTILLFGILGCIGIVLTERAIIRINQLDQRELIVFSIKGESALAFRDGKDLVFALTDSVNLKPWEKFSFNIQGYLSRSGVKNFANAINLETKREKISSANLKGICNEFGGWLEFYGKTIFVPLQENHSSVTSSQKMAVDYILITKDLKSDIHDVMNIIEPQKVIIDASVPVWKVEKIITYLQAKGIKHHVMEERGAFVLKI